MHGAAAWGGNNQNKHSLQAQDFPPLPAGGKQDGGSAGGLGPAGPPAGATGAQPAPVAAAAAAAEPPKVPDDTNEILQGDNKWGLKGLLSTIRMTNQDMNILALGFDLTALGLDLQSPEQLHPNFSSPWTRDNPKAQPEYKLPPCYFLQPPHLKFGTFRLFQLETLFYIFYSMPHDVLQLAAAQELFNRDWRYHKEKKMWLIRAPDVEPSVKTATHETGSYIFFRPDKWVQDKVDQFMVEYDKLEVKVGDGMTQQPQPQQQQPPPQPQQQQAQLPHVA